jgi:hypothetical protein
MWSAKRQAMIDAPVASVWALVGDPASYDEWWPRIVRVDADEFVPGCEYRHVVKGLFGRTEEHTVAVEELDDCHVIQVRCVEPGITLRWVLTEARGSTFVEAEFGVEIDSVGMRVVGALVGKRFMRRWVEDSLDALDGAATRARAR